MMKVLVNGNCLFQGFSGIPNDLRSIIKFLAADDSVDLSVLASTKQAIQHWPWGLTSLKQQLDYTQRSFAPHYSGYAFALLNVMYSLVRQHKVVPLHPLLQETWFAELFGKYGFTEKSLSRLSFVLSTYLHKSQEIVNCRLDTSGYKHYISYNFENTTVSQQTQHHTRVHDFTPFFLPHTVKDVRAVSRKYFRLLRRQRRRGTIFVANSKQTAWDLIKLGVDERKIRLFYCRPADVFLENKQRTGTEDKRDCITWCSTIEKRKNLETYLDALELLAHEKRKGDLPNFCIVGNKGWNYSGEDYAFLLNRIKALQTKISLVMYTNVSPHFLARIFRRSIAFVSTSFAEGFNLPSVEASYCGAKPILTDVPVHLEIHGANAVYFPISNSAALADLIGDLVYRGTTNHQCSYLDRLYESNSGSLLT